jgi:thiol:disulfide interchange protein DsbC
MIRRFTWLACVYLCAAGVGTAVAAPAASPPDPASTALLGLLSQRFPNIHIDEVRPSTLPGGLYEVITDTQLVYSDASGDHLFVGSIIDTHTRQDLTAKRWGEINQVDFDSLPLDQAIKTVRGNGTRRYAVFEDPLCPFCRKLEQETHDLTDVTIYTFLFPIEQLHPGATERAREIWCAPDRSAAWSEWMLSPASPAPNGAPSAGTKCSQDPLSANAALAKQLRVNATPTLIFSDGSRVTSAISKDELERHLGTMAPIASSGSVRAAP